MNSFAVTSILRTILYVKKIFMANQRISLPQLALDNSSSKPQYAALLMRGIHFPRRFAPGIIPNSLWLLDSSTIKFQCTMFLKIGSQIPLRCASGIVRLAFRTSLRSFYHSATRLV